MKKCCRNCLHAQFELTPTGRPKRKLAGRCRFPLPEVPANLPACVEPVVFRKTAIWPDHEDCPVWEPKK
jgi:hypothetical protein